MSLTRVASLVAALTLGAALVIPTESFARAGGGGFAGARGGGFVGARARVGGARFIAPNVRAFPRRAVARQAIHGARLAPFRHHGIGRNRGRDDGPAVVTTAPYYYGPIDDPTDPTFLYGTPAVTGSVAPEVAPSNEPVRAPAAVGPNRRTTTSSAPSGP